MSRNWIGVVVMMALVAATLSAAESKDEGWAPLFDGRSLKGWTNMIGGAIPEAWAVKDGILVHQPNKKGGDIITEKTYENFELVWEWMIPKKDGNNGVKYRVQQSPGGAIGPEFQMMADGDLADKHATGGLYDLLPPQNKPKIEPGAWQQSRIIVKGDHAEHWLNGVKTLEYTFGSDAWKAARDKSKFKDNPKYGYPASGHIALTSHGDEAHFRNIRIRELTAQ
jgi:hypothetical protein